MLSGFLRILSGFHRISYDFDLDFQDLDLDLSLIWIWIGFDFDLKGFTRTLRES